MAVLTDEGLAGIRLLICMAKADGILKPDEKYALEDALAGLKLPEGLTVDKLLEESNDSAALAAAITSPEARDYTYASVYAVAYCDRDLDAAEEKILASLRQAWGISKDEEQGLQRALQPCKQADCPAGATPAAISDEEKRKAAFDKLLSRYCIVTALTGAIPIPFVSDVLVVPMQLKMVYDVAALFGQKAERGTVQLMVESLLGGTFARVGISALCKLVPGWGSVVGATTSFATTFALGKVAFTYYAGEGRQSIESLKPLFRDEKELGKQEYKKQKAALDEAQRAHGDTFRQLAFDLQNKKITQAEYEQKMDALT